MQSTTRVPLFLAPAFRDAVNLNVATVRTFASTASANAKGKTPRKAGRDSNKQRGVSAMRSTGPRARLSVQTAYPDLPTPRAHRRRFLESDEFKTNPDHGLYGFFNKDRATLLSPAQEEFCGSAWKVADLTFKSFEDLHALWWKCLLEMNRIRTREGEFKRLRAGFGQAEIDSRIEKVQATMTAIKKVLTHRQEAYEQARLILERDDLITIDEQLTLAEETEAANDSPSNSIHRELPKSHTRMDQHISQPSTTNLHIPDHPPSQGRSEARP